MSFISYPSSLITSIKEFDIDLLMPHEHVVKARLNSLILYLQALEEDIILSSIIVCDKTNIIIDGHHRFYALKSLGVNKIPVTFINYDSTLIKAYDDDRIQKNHVLEAAISGKLLEPKSTKHVVFDNKILKYKPIILLSSLWHFSLNK